MYGDDLKEEGRYGPGPTARSDGEVAEGRKAIAKDGSALAEGALAGPPTKATGSEALEAGTARPASVAHGPAGAGKDGLLGKGKKNGLAHKAADTVKSAATAVIVGEEGPDDIYEPVKKNMDTAKGLAKNSQRAKRGKDLSRAGRAAARAGQAVPATSGAATAGTAAAGTATGAGGTATAGTTTATAGTASAGTTTAAGGTVSAYGGTVSAYGGTATAGTATTAGSAASAASGAVSAYGGTASAASGAATATAGAATAGGGATATTGTAAAAGGGAPVALVAVGIVLLIVLIAFIGMVASGVVDQVERNAAMASPNTLGLPAWITNEMIMTALEEQEAGRDPAGCNLAQMIKESGGNDDPSELAKSDNNLYGMKWSSAYAGIEGVAGPVGYSTQEFADGQYVTTTAEFISFKSATDCIKFRSEHFLQSPVYTSNEKIMAGIEQHDSDLMADGLAEDWATDPGYADGLKAVMDQYGLRRFDTMTSEGFQKSLSGDMAKVALSQEGEVGGQPYWSWYGFSGRVDWCACFVSWCADQCGYIETGQLPKFASVPDGADWFKGQGRWADASYIPKPGDLAFFDWEGDGSLDHVGIVESVVEGDDGSVTIWIVEGNASDSVRHKSYAAGQAGIAGYGIL